MQAITGELHTQNIIVNSSWKLFLKSEDHTEIYIEKRSEVIGGCRIIVIKDELGLNKKISYWILRF